MSLQLPSEYEWGFVTGRIIHARGDSTLDEDRLPEAAAASGTVRFTPLVQNNKASDSLVIHEVVECGIDNNGRLSDAESLPGVWLIAGVYRVEFMLASGTYPFFEITVTSSHTLEAPLDLANIAPDSFSPGTPVTTLVVPTDAFDGAGLGWETDGLAWLPGAAAAAASAAEALASEEAAELAWDGAVTAQGLAEDARDQAVALVGEANIVAAVDDYLTANPSSGSPDATTLTKGIIQLAGDLGGTADAPTVPGLADKSDTDHGHAISDVNGLQTALDGKQATHEALTIDGDATLPSEHQVITLRVSSPATLSIADAPDGTVITAHVAYGWEDVTWAPEVVVQGQASTTETWLVLVRSEGQWKVLVSGEDAGSGGGSISGLNVITGQWPPPLPKGEYPEGTLYVRDPGEYLGPGMAVKSSGDWKVLALDRELSRGSIDLNVFTQVTGEVFKVGWLFNETRSEGYMSVYAGTIQNPGVAPEPGDILCTYDPSALTGPQQDCMWDAGADMAGVLTGMVRPFGESVPLGIHHLIIDQRQGIIKYLWPVAGAPLAYDDQLHLTWPVTIKSDYWESASGGGGGGGL